MASTPLPSTLLLRSVAERSPTAMAVVSAAGRLAWANDAFRTLMEGYDALSEGKIVTGRPSASTQLRQSVERALRSGQAVTLTAVPLGARDDQSSRFVDIDIRPLGRERTGTRGRALLTVQEVTERVLEHERAGLFYKAFQSSTNAMEVTDREGILVDVNPAFESIYGYTRAECIGRKPSLVRSRYTSLEVYQHLWRDLLDPGRGFWSGEIINCDRSGRERPVLLTITSVRNTAGEPTHFLGVAVDLTERKAWERAAAHADKLASLGQLAAGVAHEINTPLSNVLLVAESIRRKTSDEWVRSRVDTIREQVRVADRIVLGLLDFARRSAPHVVGLNLAGVAHDAVVFVQGKQSPEVELLEVYPPEPVPIQADRSQIIQVLANVLNNAYDATEGSGQIRIEVRREGGSAVVEVSDSGPGIPDSVLPHLFEPFFTTKPEGRGTGLGLAICHGIVQAHHGTIQASNQPSGGARFVLTFPLDGGSAAPRALAGMTPAASEHPASEPRE